MRTGVALVEELEVVLDVLAAVEAAEENAGEVRRHVYAVARAVEAHERAVRTREGARDGGAERPLGTPVPDLGKGEAGIRRHLGDGFRELCGQPRERVDREVVEDPTEAARLIVRAREDLAQLLARIVTAGALGEGLEVEVAAAAEAGDSRVVRQREVVLDHEQEGLRDGGDLAR